MQDSREIDIFWRRISNTVDELVACLDGLDGDSLNWSPLDDANSLYVLATHTMGNVRHNLLNVLCGLPITRDRDAEFVARGASAAEIEARWNELKARIAEAIEELPPPSWTATGSTPTTGSSPATRYLSSSPATPPNTTARPSLPATWREPNYPASSPSRRTRRCESDRPWV